MADRIVKATASVKIHKTAADVYDAIVDPARISRYFVSSSSGVLKDGATITWEWSDVGASCTVKGKPMQSARQICFEWAPAGSDSFTDVTITLEPVDDGTTKVTATESGWALSEEGTARAVGQTGGWMHMLLCLKAYMQFGVALRE